MTDEPQTQDPQQRNPPGVFVLAWLCASCYDASLLASVVLRQSCPRCGVAIDPAYLAQMLVHRDAIETLLRQAKAEWGEKCETTPP
jgi:ribosomal protein S27AE